MADSQFVSNGALPQTRVWGELVGGQTGKKKILKFRTPSTLERRGPCSPLGEEPVGKELGVLVPLGPDAYIASCAVENDMPIGEVCLVHPAPRIE